jgi:hypothetical protein
MRLALECPTSLLQEIQPLGDFDFVLSHLVLKDKEYADFYRNSDRYLILDNSTNELLAPLSEPDIAKAAKIVNPDLVVAPDYLNDMERTLDALNDTVNYFGIRKVLPVVQGATVEECIVCADRLWNRGFDFVAVPYDITCERTDSLGTMALARQKVVQAITHMGIPLIVHLLGLTLLEELSRYGSEVKSIDTGSPVLHGLSNRRYGRDTLLSKSTPTMNKMPVIDAENEAKQMRDVYYNLAYLRTKLDEVIS